MHRKMNPWIVMAFLVLILALAGCQAAQDPPAGEAPAAGTGAPAMVDNVVVEEQLAHSYAYVTGSYPDSCTRISAVEQSVDGNSIKISLSVDAPEDLMCAQMITPFDVLILLEVGGLMPGEYTVDVHGVTTSFTLGG